MKVVLYCECGVTTSLLVSRMRRYADPDDIVESYGMDDVADTIRKFDVVLVGPQIRHKLDEISRLASAAGARCGIISMRVYGTMDGEAVMRQARELMEDRPRSEGCE